MSTSPHPVGAPRGNHNALKHGFYSNRFTVPRHPDKVEVGTLNLSSEISILRLYIARVVELTPPDETLESARDTLRLLCIASTALARLVRAQFLIQGSQGESLADQIFSIAEEVRQEMVARGKAEAAAKSPPTKPAPSPEPIQAVAPTGVAGGLGDSDLRSLPFREGLGVGSSSHPALPQDRRDAPCAPVPPRDSSKGDRVPPRRRHPSKNSLATPPVLMQHPQAEGEKLTRLPLGSPVWLTAES